MPEWLACLELIARGALIVTLTAANVTHIGRGQYRMAFVTGAAISVVWFLNTRRTVTIRRAWLGAMSYGLGAGLGTVLGMWLAR